MVFIYLEKAQLKISYSRDFLLTFHDLEICKKLPGGFDATVLSEVEEAFSGAHLPSSRRSEYGSLPSRLETSTNYSRSSLGRWDTCSSRSSDKDQDGEGGQLKNSYSRDFLLAFRDLEVCKKLPGGFDATVLSELEDAFSGAHLSSLRRSEYGSLPSRLESSTNYSRSSLGRWDTCSSGSSDKDQDVQSERESFTQADSGRRFGNQSRRFSHNTEHDGLLGSGAFPRPSGYTGASAPKGWGNSQYQLNRSNEPYQPPRPYKAVPFTRKSNTDAFNDETFGSDQISNRDRAEEERKRRESFELMRREQQKALKEKQKQIHNSYTHEHDSDVVSLFETAEVQINTQSADKLHEIVTIPHGLSDSSKSLSMQVSLSRPLVPPGFSGAQLDKSTQLQCSDAIVSEVDVVRRDNDCLNLPDISQEENSYPPAGADISQHSVGFENVKSNRFDVHEFDKAQLGGVLVNSSDMRNLKSETVNADTLSSVSILEKLLGSSVFSTVDSPSNIVNQVYHADGVISNQEDTESSKFVMGEDVDNKTAQGSASMDLLSLIVSKEEGPPKLVTEAFNNNEVQENCPIKLDDTSPLHVKFPAPSSLICVSDTYHHQSERKDSHSGVLTCEDLEQIILSEVEDIHLGVHHVHTPSSVFDGKNEDPKRDVDDLASQHLLSLLQKGDHFKDSMPLPGRNAVMPSGAAVPASDAFLITPDGAAIANPGKNRSSEHDQTLEALFGAAFMSELQSIDAPLSLQRGSIGKANDTNLPQSHGVPTPTEDDGLFSRAEVHLKEKNQNKTLVPLSGNGLPPYKGSRLGELGLRESAAKIGLSEEDSFIAFSDALGPNPAALFGNARTEEPVKAVPEEHDSILLSIIREGERPRMTIPGGQPTNLRPHDRVEPDNIYHHMHNGPLQFSHPLDHQTIRNSHMNFMGPEAVHTDSRHPYASDVFPHAFQSLNGPSFDSHQSMFNQMHMPANIPPHHSLQAFQGGTPVSLPRRLMNQNAVYPSPGMSQMQNFPPNYRPPAYSGHGVGMQGEAIGSSEGLNPEALEMLIQMEMMRASSNQSRPSVPGYNPGFPGTEPNNMPFRFRSPEVIFRYNPVQCPLNQSGA